MTMASGLNARQVLAQFDKLQADGELFYNPTSPIPVVSGGLEFEFRVVPSFSAKPQLAAAGEKTRTAQSSRRPPPSDGSDIDHSDPAFFVAFVTNEKGEQTHKLILNKFCVFRPQYLLLTTDATKKQTSVLDHDDLFAAWTILNCLNDPDPHYVLFNCCREGGSSRSHKHMQVLACPKTIEGARSLMWPGAAVEEALNGKGTQGSSGVLPLPYTAFYKVLDPNDQAAHREMYQGYKLHLKECADALDSRLTDAPRQEADTTIPHNIILTRQWLMTIPRRSPTVDGIHGQIVNATGMAGLVWLSNHLQLEGWKQRGPVDVLKSLGVPSLVVDL